MKGTAEVLEEYCAGLKDLDGFSHIILLYHFHRSQRFKLHIVPLTDPNRRAYSPRVPRYHQA